ncbi:divergent PAP2 family protein [Bacillaceae bacterium IKA-2]|nr:divergent PAP2 family protein [Bacillaceae bacterium IKA-2]
MKGVITALIAIVLAQLLKVPIKRVQTGDIDLKQTLASGGMPSSHSAGVTALATYVGLKLGSRTLDFAIAFIFGIIVMYDAQGVRKHAGETAIKVNELEKRLDQLSGDNNDASHNRKTMRLKENIGHQLAEVVGGAVLGFFVGLIGYLTRRKNKYIFFI